MKLTQALVAALTLITITACKTIDIKDGQIPSQYLSQAKKLEGTYKGEFNGVVGNLVIHFNGNKPVVEYHNSRGDDLLNNNCHSSFGDLLEVYIKSENKNPRVSSTLFDFNAADCSFMVRGREITLSFKETDRGMRADLRLLQDVRQRQVCNVNPGAPPNIPPSQSCTWEPDPIYLDGRFLR